MSIFAKIEMKGKFRGAEGQTKWAWTKGKWQRAKYLHEAAASFIFRDTKQQALQVFLLQRIIYTCTEDTAVSVWNSSNDSIKGQNFTLQASKMTVEENSNLRNAQAVVQQLNTHPPQPSQPRVWTLACLASAS